MKPRALEAVSFGDVAAYLRDRSWTLYGPVGPQGQLWTIENDHGQFEVVIPIVEGVSDRLHRLREAFQVIAKAEARGFEEVVEWFEEGLVDSIAIALSGAALDSGAVPLHAGP